MSNTNGNSIIGALRDYFNECELFDEKIVGVDGLPQKQNAYSIGTMPIDEVLKNYIDKSSLRQYVFELTASYPQADTQEQNTQNAAFFEAFSNWMYEQSKAKNFPLLPNGCTVHKIEAMSSGYFDAVKNDTRVYAIQCRVVYLKKSVR